MVKSMVSKCANPECQKPFYYLREGKLFRFEVQPNPEAAGGKKSAPRLRHFWLCGPCSTQVTLTYTHESGVTVVPIHPNTQRAAAS
jgi:hypothetical protein